MRLKQFNPQAKHLPGKQMVVLSRCTLTLEQEPHTVVDVQAFVDLVESTRPAIESHLKRIRVATAKDAQLQKVIDFTSQGWPTSVEDDTRVLLFTRTLVNKQWPSNF